MDGQKQRSLHHTPEETEHECHRKEPPQQKQRRGAEIQINFNRA